MGNLDIDHVAGVIFAHAHTVDKDGVIQVEEALKNIKGVLREYRTNVIMRYLEETKKIGGQND